MNKILIALDYTPAAEKVAGIGYAVASGMKAEIALVHVITEAAYYAINYSPIMGYKGSYTDGAVEVVKDIRKEAELFLSAAAAHLGNKQITTHVLEGEITQALLTFIKEWNADILVIGTHSHHGLDRIFGTDTAHTMLKHASIPVLAVPTDDKEG
jgi:nucleotide-binding universal stress UspA family protein